LLVTKVHGTAGTLGDVASLRLFARAREIAGVDEVVSEAVRRFGPGFAELLPSCRIWLNGESVLGSTAVTDKDEVAVLPPVSGGCR
jgi:molybdopterin converting factor small subunit